jgi:hypothetical protein
MAFAHPDKVLRLVSRAACRLLLPLLLAAPAWAVDVVVFDRPASQNDFRREYARSLLRTVLERTTPEYGPWRMELAPAHMERRRLLAALKEGKWVNVTAYPASGDWMRALKAVPVPIDMGLQSWRIALIDKRSQPQFRALGPAQLKLLRAGANNAWVTYRSLQQNGFSVVSGGNYDGLFDMLMAGRFDFLPRGVNEIFRELEAHRREYPDLAVEESFLLHDQIPSLFFVSPHESRLHKRIAAGMEAMLKDGSLERLVLRYHGAELKRAALCHRKRIELSSGELDPALAARRELWLDPFDPRHGFCPAR